MCAMKRERDGEEQVEPLSKHPKVETTACPYLVTIDRSRLDFDFEKLCSVSMQPNNVYTCLVCGKYFQGRGRDSPAYVHSLQCSHHVYLNLTTKRAYCLPDGYEVVDSSLDDIKVLKVSITFSVYSSTSSAFILSDERFQVVCPSFYA